MRLVQAEYGEARVRLHKVRRRAAVHDIRDITVRVGLQGDFEEAYTRGDNSRVLPTDTMKNTVYGLARQHAVDRLESFGVALVDQFLSAKLPVSRVTVELEEQPWIRIMVAGRDGRQPHPHAFVRSGTERWCARVTGERKGAVVESGTEGLRVLKSAGAGFEGFARDPFTTLEETRDRILATEVSARWRWAEEPPDAAGRDAGLPPRGGVVMNILLRGVVLVWIGCACVVVAGAETVGKEKQPLPQGAAAPSTDPAQPGTLRKVGAKRLPKGAAAPVEERGQPAPERTSPPGSTPAATPIAPPAPNALPPGKRAPVHADDGFTGTWMIGDDPSKSIEVRSHGEGMYELQRAGEWEALGFFDGTEYWGLFRSGMGAGGKGAQYGTHHGMLQHDGSLHLRGALHGAAADFEQVWTHGNQRVIVVDDTLPNFGEYVYVEELPEAVGKVEAVYPPEARKAGVDGTVMVQAFVGKDGRVHGTKVVKSIPMLDDAAVAAVRQWVFKPALSKGAPVAVWVAVPVKFSLH
jgi:urate oxidase